MDCFLYDKSLRHERVKEGKTKFLCVHFLWDGWLYSKCGLHLQNLAVLRAKHLQNISRTVILNWLSEADLGLLQHAFVF